MKEKRHRIKPLLTRLHREFNVSAAELDRLDHWDEAIIGCAVIANESQYAQNMLSALVGWLNRNWPDVMLVDNQIEILK